MSLVLILGLGFVGGVLSTLLLFLGLGDHLYRMETEEARSLSSDDQLYRMEPEQRRSLSSIEV